MDAFKEIVRQGERQLADQKEQTEAVLGRAGELMRLGIAVVGGLIVIGGILATRRVHLDGWSLVGLAGGLVMAITCIGGLASLLAGVAGLGRVAHGPNLRKLSEHAPKAAVVEILESLTTALPDWAERNDRTMAQMHFVMGVSLLLLAAGVVLLLVTFVYILGGTILG